MIVKVSVQFGGPTGNRVEYELDRELPLTTHLINLCQKLNVAVDPSSYVLQVESTKHYIEDGDLSKVEFSLANGSTIILKLKPAIAASNYIQSLQDPNINTKKKAIFEVRGLLKDEAFAHEFLTLNGITYITNLIGEATGNTLAYALSALQEAMSYGYGFDSLPMAFIQKIITCIDASNLNVCRSALEILILLSNSPKYGFKTLEGAFTSHAQDKQPFANLINLLATPDVNIQLNTLTLINNLVKHCDTEYATFTKTLEKLGIDQHLKKTATTSDTDFKKQMYIFQKNRLKDLKTYREQSYNKQNPEHEETLMKLWTITFPNVKLETRVSEQWKLLGFQGTDPATDFRGMGLLGLQNLIYFAENYTDTFRKIVTVQAERKERDYPVAVAGINVTQMLCELLRVFQDAEQTGGPYTIFPVLFDHQKAFEELYCIAFRVLDTTWDEMNASYMDFPRVIAAVKKQVTDALASNPVTIDQFNKLVWSGSRSNKQASAPEEEQENTADPEPVNKLRAKLKQEMFDLFKQERVAFLIEGSWFKQPRAPKGKQTTFTFYKLSDNKQELLSGTSATNASIPELTVVAKLSDIADLTTGVNTPMFSKQKKLSPQDEEIAALSFSLLLKESSGKTIDFTANNKDDFIHWTDGLRLLLSDKIENSDTFEEIKVLTALELRIKLLALEGIQIPQQAPAVPAPLSAELLDM